MIIVAFGLERFLISNFFIFGNVMGIFTVQYVKSIEITIFVNFLIFLLIF
jgi:hypothetical protein